MTPSVSQPYCHPSESHLGGEPLSSGEKSVPLLPIKSDPLSLSLRPLVRSSAQVAFCRPSAVVPKQLDRRQVAAFFGELVGNVDQIGYVSLFMPRTRPPRTWKPSFSPMNAQVGGVASHVPKRAGSEVLPGAPRERVVYSGDKAVPAPVRARGPSECAYGRAAYPSAGPCLASVDIGPVGPHVNLCDVADDACLEESRLRAEARRRRARCPSTWPAFSRPKQAHLRVS